ncbi:uncharacterized protein YbjT (DUF2867 family) [Orbus hercynius]|uniref:Uncharacterized protein YbjT (DUF2867 family) n=1 Tax=Orbus hercynius TaxID=593135 RepID=A0A495RK84_9GAMM|nr:NAD(P)H-binding protein [Orbus hercynius]RKS87741.1 uncharacterized protein YbjT (DUF2867 family) [Orbus hercynius]
MKSLLIFGASRGTGEQVVKHARKQGYRCVAVVRQQAHYDALLELGVEPILGDANDIDIIEKACLLAGKDCTIVSTLGGNQANYQPQMHIINQAEKHQINHMVLITSLGCGDSWSTLSERAKAAFGYAVREKTLAEAWLQTSLLDYCILRPGGLTNGEATHNARCDTNTEVHGYIRRHDLALVILDKIQQPQLGNNIYSVIDPDLVVERS